MDGQSCTIFLLLEEPETLVEDSRAFFRSQR
jgi:hypothetical protein